MARTVELLLRENVKNLGKCGDIVRVSPGFARNFLVPRKIAIDATEDNKKAMLRRRVVLDAAEATKNAEVDALVALINGLELTTSARADDHGHLFGSVNAAAIVELLKAKGHVIAEKAVRLDAPLKEVGTFPVKVHIHAERTAEVKVIIARELST